MQELAQDFQISSWTSIWVSGNFSILAVVGCLQLVQAAVVSQGAFLDHSLEKSLGVLAMGHGCWVGMFQPMESPKMCWWCKSYIIPFQAIDTFILSEWSIFLQLLGNTKFRFKSILPSTVLIWLVLHVFSWNPWHSRRGSFSDLWPPSVILTWTLPSSCLEISIWYFRMWRSSTKPFDFVFLISWWSSKWWQLSGSQNGPMDINDGILRFFHRLEVLHHQCEERWRWSRWRWSKLRLGCFSWWIRSKVKDGDWVTWYPNYRMHGKAHWRWKSLTLQWSHIFSLTSSNTDRSNQLLKRQVPSFLNSVARP